MTAGKNSEGPKFATIDGNEAAAYVAYRTNEVMAIYPITPSSPIAEWCDQWASEGKRNLWGTIPAIVEMQSEGGAAGAVHGALQTGALSTTFTASQGLLLMLPNMFKIAGELLPTVFHVTARTVATHALSIFGDHSDIMVARSTGWAILGAASVQETMDFAVISQAAALRTGLPFVHYCPAITQKVMDEFAAQTGRQYRLFDYTGSPEVERVLVIMGSGAEVAEEVVTHLNALGAKVGVLKVRLYRPFDGAAFVAALPDSVTAIAVLDRTKEPGATGEPLYQDCITALVEQCANGASLAWEMPVVVGGRYGLSSKEFTPAMVKAVFDNLARPTPKNHFTVGINDDVSLTSLPVDPDFSTESDDVIRALFYGLGSDGTVGANKNSIKIIGENTPFHAQGYFVYDSKKAGSVTVSHLRFGRRPIQSSYLITRANFIACHQPLFLERRDMLRNLAPGGTFLLNSPHSAAEIWPRLPTPVQEALIERQARFFVIDATSVARASGMGGRINTIMQACFFALSGVLPAEEAVAAIKSSIKKSYAKKGEEIVRMNLKAVDNTLANLFEVPLTGKVNGTGGFLPPITADAPRFVREVLGTLAAGRGGELPVSAFPRDGTFPTATAKFEKRNLAFEIPV